ncbi:MAG TPA: hypothetical protein VK580_06440 [Steroidobacteraceae bacterium]|nr:hypothetical protein [Steroidobacteraceae bacterium]
MPESTVPKSFSPYTADRRIVVLGVLFTTIVLAYFYAADNYFLSTRRMTPIFRHLLMVDDSKTAWLSLAVCIVAAFWKSPIPVFKVIDFVGSRVTTVVAATVALLALGAILIYHNDAFSMDEYAAVFQAKTFAAGRLTVQLPPSVINWLIPPGFNGAFLVASRTTGQAMEAYWPGFSLILAPFEFLGVPWLCNSILAGIAIFLIHRITLEITNDRRAAGWAVLFTLASGTFAAYAISYYSMQAHLTANLLFVWLLLKPNPYRAFGAGVVGSLALVLHNPFPHILFAAPWIIAFARSKDQRQSFFALILGYLSLTFLVGAGWLYLRELVTSGNSGFNVISDNVNTVFRLPDRSMIDIRVAEIVKMWIWAVPCLLLLAVLGRLRRGDDQHIRLLTQSAVLTFVGYLFFIFDQGHGWGYRYFHSAWGVVPILAACAMNSQAQSNDRLAAFAGAAAILNLVLVVPMQMMQMNGIITRHSAQLPSPRRPGNNVYFVSDGGFYRADLVQSDPLLRDNDLILFSRGDVLDAELMRQNWPAAVLVERRIGVEEWNLGPKDQRQVSKDLPGIKRFVFSYSGRALSSGSLDARPRPDS